MQQTWDDAQKWEKEWHGSCVNSINEELKQLVYAQRMGLGITKTPKTPISFDLQGKSILDVGGGAYSLLLKCVNFKSAIVVDPIVPPEWVLKRYEAHGVDVINEPAETGLDGVHFLDEEMKYDEAWIYNCLQHTIDPEKIISNVRKMAKLVRIFEWIDTPVTMGHLHTLKEEKLNDWLHGEGKVEMINQYGCVGKCYYGIFPVQENA